MPVNIRFCRSIRNRHTGKIIEKEEGPLPNSAGIGALAELRRVKWFQMVGLKTPYLPDLCRLIRGLAIKESSWRSFRALCPWNIALILHKIITYEKTMSGQGCRLRPALILECLLNCLSKGFRFPILEEEVIKRDFPNVKTEAGQVKLEAESVGGGFSESVDALISVGRKRASESKKYTHKLVDPCELDQADSLAHISVQRKNDIRACAKYALDLMNREQTCLLLNTPVVEGVAELNQPGIRENQPAVYDPKKSRRYGSRY